METAQSSSSSHSFTPWSPSTALIYWGLTNAGTETCPERLVRGSTNNTLHIIYSLCSLTCCALLETNVGTSKITHTVNPLLRLAGPCGLTQASRDLSNSGGGEHKPEEGRGRGLPHPPPILSPLVPPPGGLRSHHRLLCCQSPGGESSRSGGGQAARAAAAVHICRS